MFSNSYFGIVLSFVVFECAKYLNSKIHNGKLRAICNPLLISILFIVGLLSITKISYEDYNRGASLITFFIGPATVALMVSLYDNLKILKENIVAILTGILVGSFISMLITVILAKVFNVDKVLIITLLPESVTSAIAIGLSEEYGGIIALSAVSVLIRGIIGIIIAPLIINIFNVYDPIAQGIGLGTIAHALGTAKAREMGDIQGAMSGLSIAVAGIVTVILMPLFVLLSQFI